MERIQIDGEWYVKESSLKYIEAKIENKDLIKFEGVLYENDCYCWEATKIYKDDGITFYGGIDIKFTDKTVNPFKEEHWDNDVWYLGVYENRETDLAIAREVMSLEGISYFKVFISKLKELNWL